MFFRNRTPKSTPPWLTWIVLAVVVYAMFAGHERRSETGQKNAESSKERITAEAERLSTIGKTLLPTFTVPIRVTDDKIGQGEPAVCGQKVTLRYRSFMGKDQLIEEVKSTSLTLGAGKALPALDRGVIGMRASGERTIRAMAHMAYDAEGFAREAVQKGTDVRFEVILKSAEPALPNAETSGYRVIEQSIGAGGSMFFCGQSVNVKLVIWDMHGRKIFTSDAVRFTTGASEVFLGLEQGVIGMNPGGARMLIVPPAFQKTMRGNAPGVDFPLPKNETVLVEVEALR